MAEREVRRTIPRGLEGRKACPHTGRTTPRLIIITFYEHLTQSVSHSDTASGLSARHVNALCQLCLLGLVAATHTVIRGEEGRQVAEEGKVNSDLSCWADGGRGSRLDWMLPLHMFPVAQIVSGFSWTF